MDIRKNESFSHIESLTTPKGHSVTFDHKLAKRTVKLKNK